MAASGTGVWKMTGLSDTVIYELVPAFLLASLAVWGVSRWTLKKAGESKTEVNRAQSTATTKTGVIGVKVAIMAPTAKIYDRVEVNDALRAQLIANFTDGTVKLGSEKPSGAFMPDSLALKSSTTCKALPTQAVTQAGCNPASRRWLQKVHFSTFCVIELNCGAP